MAACMRLGAAGLPAVGLGTWKVGGDRRERGRLWGHRAAAGLRSAARKGSPLRVSRWGLVV